MGDLIERQELYHEMTVKSMELFENGLAWHEFRRGFDFAMEFVQEAPSAEKEQRWIPVTERLPKKENKSYWICTNTKHQCECRWTNNIYGIGKSNNWGWSIFDIPQYTRVIAWMPLPESYKGE